ncbi:aminodeoxychorismate/anthranilate synthase component II [Kordiimonas sediminis]|uniref:Aminodeoxychorismate/anthranilate synthase component II n=1 Tax=Kordiimonas sediminis TaxID=1735581 RepID=A0A919EAF3_9PROT|nr:aminodeoxychorismate/anthranilate synthase component II [Kordiimonas sediminis]GHF28411.1 aminodeoxychorismate/anthranilate synthase component II [Kordiimonas sediminis]
MYILIDNYDSFTYNLYHYFVELGADVVVHRNDKITVDEVLALNPEGIIISPGPCSPNEAGICLDLIEAAKGKIPIFGVCLGFQSMGQVFGGNVVRAPYVMHGKVSKISNTGSGVFGGLPPRFDATRYHSLIVDRDTLPPCMEITAETDDGLIMGFQHKEYPIHGVQFHPESIASEHGHSMLKNFMNICEAQA